MTKNTSERRKMNVNELNPRYNSCQNKTYKVQGEMMMWYRWRRYRRKEFWDVLRRRAARRGLRGGTCQRRDLLLSAALDVVSGGVFPGAAAGNQQAKASHSPWQKLLAAKKALPNVATIFLVMQKVCNE